MARDWIQDAGHGGGDPGASANGIIEKVYTLEAAKYVDRRLGELGIASDMTRDKDATLNENIRVGMVSKYDKCLSHHYNAGGGDGAEFIHSIYSDGKFEKMLAKEFEDAGYPVRPRATYSRKGSNGDYYYMHRRTGSCRTTIIEYDFVDGPNHGKLKSKNYREGMYECVVKAVAKDAGVKYTKPGGATSSKQKDEYIVKPGDSLSEIASKNKTTVKKLVDINKLRNPDLISVGQIIKLPTSAAEKPKKTQYVQVKADELWVYDKADWNAKHKLVKKDEVFTIKKTITVNGSKMHQLKSGLYITNNSDYVKVYSK